MEKGPAYGNYGYHYRYYKSEEAGTKKHVIEPENIGVFDYVNEMDIRLQAYNKPDGSRRFPAKSCKELKECYPEMPSGDYWIDANGASNVDAFLATCNFDSNPQTCVQPKVRKIVKDTWTSEKVDGFRWMLEEIRSEEDELEYEAHPVQMELLRIDSERMSQNVTMVTYHCQTKKPKLRVLSNDEHTLGTNLLRKIEDECYKSTRLTDDSDREFHRRVFEVDTTKMTRLPIADVAISDVGSDEKFGLEVGPICFQ